MCWEPCFTQYANHHNLDLLRAIHKIGNDAKRLKDINDANKIFFFLDNSVAEMCPESSSSSSSSSDETMSYELEHGATAAQIFAFQLQLMTIISTMMGSVYTYPIQFNENAAWTCDEFSRLDNCQIFTLTDGNYLSSVQTNLSSCDSGLLEPACEAGFHAYENYEVNHNDGRNAGRLAIAILNSNAHSHVHKRGHFAKYSPCSTYFPVRYAVGLHRAQRDDLNRFSSHRDYNEYVSDDLEAIELVRNLYNCMSSACCPSNSATITPAATCNMASGHIGENHDTITLADV